MWHRGEWVQTNLNCWVLSKEVSSTIFKVFAMTPHGHLDHWWTLYPQGQWAISFKRLSVNIRKSLCCCMDTFFLTDIFHALKKFWMTSIPNFFSHHTKKKSTQLNSSLYVVQREFFTLVISKCIFVQLCVNWANKKRINNSLPNYKCLYIISVIYYIFW